MRTGLKRVTVGLLALSVALSVGGCGNKDASQPPTPAPSAAVTSATPKETSTPTEPAVPNTDPLTGGKRSDAEVFAVKIDNVAAAHPQVGVGRADIVVVERVEANLTRMIAIFHTGFPTRVGPVRSARNTDLQYLPMFGKPGLVFSGANSKVLAQVKKASVVPIERSDRDPSRSAPHNVIVNLKNLAKAHEVGRAKPIGLSFATTDPRWTAAAKDPSAKIKIGSDTFGFGFRGGDYSTSWNGRLNKDGDSGKAVRTTNVMVLKVKTYRDRRTTSHLSDVSVTTGTGKATIYRDGKKLSGIWTRDTVSAPMRLTDQNNQDIPLKPGQSWVLLQG